MPGHAITEAQLSAYEQKVVDSLVDIRQTEKRILEANKEHSLQVGIDNKETKDSIVRSMRFAITSCIAIAAIAVGLCWNIVSADQEQNDDFISRQNAQNIKTLEDISSLAALQKAHIENSRDTVSDIKTEISRVELRVDEKIKELKERQREHERKDR